MRSLFLLRHAKSAWDDSVSRDYDRPLNAKGRRAAAAIGGFMRTEGLAFDCVLASSAERVRQTIQGVEDGLGRALNPVFDSRVYMAGHQTLAEVVGTVPDAMTRVLLVGHNPGLEDLVLWLTPPGDGPRTHVEEKYPTCALAELAVPSAWSGLAEGAARFIRFTRPRDLDADLGPDPDEG